MYMKLIVKLLLLASFFTVAFIPIQKGDEWIILALIVVMFALVVVYYWLLYGVRERDAHRFLDPEETVRYSVFSGLVTGEGHLQDLQRGRLIITDTRVLMVVRSDNSFEVIWQHRVDEIEQFHLAKVLSFRKGVVFTLDDHTEHPFTIFRITSREDQLKDALGW